MLSSIIVSTYNRPDALRCVLSSLNNQSNSNFEVIVADDGSSSETRRMITEFCERSRYEIKHVWQEDNGFQAAKIRNKAVAQSKGEYIIFLDGDCVVFSDFISKHQLLAEKGYFVRGSRTMLSETYTQEFIQFNLIPSELTISIFLKLRLTGKLKRLLPLMPLPLGMFRYQKTKQWYGVKTCNLGVWRSDFMDINGFDEQYIGWGHEDADLAIRLINNGVHRKEGVNAVTVLHLWHALNDRSHLKENEDRLENRIQSSITRITNGVSQY